MSDAGGKKRMIFNSKLALLQPPEPHFKGEWPKKPPYWQYYGTEAYKVIHKLTAGAGVAFVILGVATWYIQPKVSLGIIDRYISPEVLTYGKEKKQLIEGIKLRTSISDLEHLHFTRDNTFEETTKEYRERLDSLQTALDSQKKIRQVGL